MKATAPTLVAGLCSLRVTLASYTQLASVSDSLRRWVCGMPTECQAPCSAPLVCESRAATDG